MIKVGDMVETIDDAIYGVVIKILGSTISIEDADGFEFQFEAKELIPFNSGTSIEQALYDSDIDAVKREKEIKKWRRGDEIYNLWRWPIW